MRQKKRPKIIIFIIFFIASIAITFVVGKINFTRKFNSQVTQLFSESKNISHKKFSYQQLEGLPKPVKRYFKRVLKNGQPYISYVRLKHGGQFKTDLKNDWVNISGEQYFTAEKPGFIWKGSTTMFVARDMYIGNEGRLIATILSTFNVVDVYGKKQYNESELLRWLAECVWFPTSLLPSEKLKWIPIDNLSAKLTFHHQGLSLFYIVTFNEKGEIVQMETKRYMDEKTKQTWIIKLNEYSEKNGVIIPIHAEVFWMLESDDFSYADFYIEEIEYNMPEKY